MRKKTEELWKQALAEQTVDSDVPETFRRLVIENERECAEAVGYFYDTESIKEATQNLSNQTKEEFIERATKECMYCGDKLTNTHKKLHNNGDFSYTGIDRYDNKKGYEKENCVPCCSVCNRLKTDMSIKDFKNKIVSILNRSDVWERTA